MTAEGRRPARAIFVLSALGGLCAVLIVLGEIYGSPQRAWAWSLGGAALGLLFVIYGVILVLMRRMGLIGPRRAER